MSYPNEDEELAAFLRELERDLLKRQIDRLEAALRAGVLDPIPGIDWKRLPAPLGAVEATLDGMLEVKAADAQSGTVHGYLSTYDLDLGNDVVLPGAYKATIAEASATARRNGSAALWPLLWQHDKSEPIGGIMSAHEDQKGLLIAAKLNLDIERGRQAFHGLQEGYLAFSIGYRPVKHRYQGKVRQLEEIKLAEGSVVTFAMNPNARATRRAA